jgi:hypothetical protein
MKATARVAPANSLLLVMDRAGSCDIPRVMRGKANVVGTKSCVAIGTLSAQDGETSIVLSDEDLPVGEPAFDGTLDTPKMRVSVCSVLLEPIIECKVVTARTRVRIWTNHPSEPDTVRIFVQRADE